jgi:hypothetical protein
MVPLQPILPHPEALFSIIYVTTFTITPGIQLQTRGGFHKSWAQGVKCRAHPKSGRKCKKLSARRKCMMQIGVNLYKKDGRRAQISGVGRKLLNEIYPRSQTAHLRKIFILKWPK